VNEPAAALPIIAHRQTDATAHPAERRSNFFCMANLPVLLGVTLNLLMLAAHELPFA